MTISISAIVPTFNRAHFLPEALSALSAQSLPLHEIIVWDDGSTDDTAAVVRALPGPIRYFHSENGGKSRALNAALAKARGQAIWICDDDDVALPNAAEHLAGLLHAMPQAGLAGGSYRRFGTDPASGRRVESGPGYWPDLSQGSPLRHLLEDIFLFQNATLVRRECYDATGPFREDLARSIDYDMIIRLAARFPVALSEEPLFLQRKHDGPRGPAAARHAAARSDAVWKQADRTVFAPFRDSLPLGLYQAMFEGTPEIARRAALLQRATVYARRTDWAHALEDFESAIATAPGPLSELEYAICRRAMGGKHGCHGAYAPQIRRPLAALAGRNAAGADMAHAMVRGVRWRLKAALRAAQFAQAARILRFGAALHSRRSAPRTGRPALEERQDLPATAYPQPPRTKGQAHA